MNASALIDSFVPDLVAIRRDIHAHPELGFKEERTSRIVADLLRSWNIEVHTGIGTTGVVGVLHGSRGTGPTIGLRADMDALPIPEESGLPYASTTPGVFHGCGHDGHTTILLGVARYLAHTRNFSGTVVFIFQPAEEGLGGARAMIADGLFKRFPCDELYGFHNWPDLDLGQITVFPGPIMAGADFFDITLRGTGSHAAMPHRSRDPIVASGSLISSVQSIVSRTIDPTEAAVVSITRIHAGSAYNVIPGEVRLSGGIRYFSRAVGIQAGEELRRIAAGCAQTFGVEAEVDIRNVFDVTVNDKKAAETAARAARAIVGEEHVSTTPAPSMGSDDLADMLAIVPGAYIFLGHKGTMPLHHPRFWFDDDLIPIGVRLIARIVEDRP
ncbi:M20 family metallopeptidase [Chelativorans sp. SCAU2101]|uniref:M20 family metallopeptidase n=1 Tax=Chelativorans petroleitrophicus TaxID=2975484 RepID=A0A9X2XCM6_9HYPH|nr:M20 aminoacylase family protein [Chelativorans petroleitrophicus]MCT8992162.1 M20 family metallopeptidase [Chelativorans petroleitrophicus]